MKGIKSANLKQDAKMSVEHHCHLNDDSLTGGDARVRIWKKNKVRVWENQVMSMSKMEGMTGSLGQKGSMG